MATKTKKPAKRKPKVPAGPTMEQRMTDVRKMAEKIQKAWPLGALHVAGNGAAVVAAFRPSTPLLAKGIMQAITDIQADLLRESQR